MFTGIIDHCGTIAAVDKMPQGLCFTITTTFKDLVLGESIAVDGVCLSVTEVNKSVFCCDVSPETLALTTLSHYKKGTKVNLERSLTVGDRMGGHYVTGHVDCTAIVDAIYQQSDYVELQLSGFSQAQARYLIPKGSITVNGVSLTINTVTQVPTLRLMLIPHTLTMTNLNALTMGSQVNIEFDYYAKAIAHQLALQAQSQEAVCL